MRKREIYSIIALLRPFTLLAPVIVSSSVMVASLCALGNSDFSLINVVFSIVIASCTFALLNGASNALNQATDINEDRLSKPYRPLPKGDLTIRQAIAIAAVLYAASLILAFLIHITFFMFIMIITSFTISYSVYPRMKKRLLWNQLWVALPRGFLGILASWSVFSSPFEPMVLAIAALAALFLFGGTTTKDILDAEADRKNGVSTMMNTFGANITSWTAFLCMASAFLIIPFLIGAGILPFSFLLLMVLCIPTVFIWWSMRHPEPRSHHRENTKAWTVMYGTYFLYALGFAVLTAAFS